MNFFKAHTIFGLFFFVFALFSAFFALTQNVHAQESLENCGSPLCVKITDQSFDEASRTVSLAIDVWNNTETFVDNISYALSLYEGEALATSGNIFSAVNFVAAHQGPLESMYMGELVSDTITFQIPQNFPDSNYFSRLTISNENKSLYGITYSKTPIAVSGSEGTFIPPLNAALIDTENNQLFGLYEGPTLATTARPTLVLLESVNPEFFAMLETEEIFLTVTSDMNTASRGEKIPLGLYLTKAGAALEVPLVFDEIRAGSHMVTLAFTDFYNNEVVPSLEARILYEGFIGSIFDVKTEINAYRKGEPIDLRVNVLTGGDPTVDKVLLDVVLRGDGNWSQKIERTIQLQQKFEGEDLWVLFSDEKIAKRTNVTAVEVTLKKIDGTVLDTQIVYLDTEKRFMYPTNTLLLVLSIIFGVLVLLGILYILKKKNIITAKIGVFIVVSVFGALSLGVATQMVYADASIGVEDAGFSFTRLDDIGSGVYEERTVYCSNNADSNGWWDEDPENSEFCIPLVDGPLMSIWSNPSNSPSGNPYDLACAGQCQDVEYYVKVQCKKCNNAPVQTNIEFYNLWQGTVPEFYTVSNAVDEAYILLYDEYVVEETFSDPNFGEITYIDTVNYWIYGPFLNEVCFLEPQDYSSPIDNTPYYSPSGVTADGSRVNHYYQITAMTMFGGDYCQVGFATELDDYGSGLTLNTKMLTLNDRRLLSCNLDNSAREFHVSVFLDEDEDGMHDIGEVFIKNDDAATSCIGTVDETLEVGMNRHNKTGTNLTNSYLDSSAASIANCGSTTEYIPYAIFNGYSDSENENYRPVINTNTYTMTGFSSYDPISQTWNDDTVIPPPTNSTNLLKQYFIDQEPYQNGPVRVRIGVTSEYPVFISCKPGQVTDMTTPESGGTPTQNPGTDPPPPPPPPPPYGPGSPGNPNNDDDDPNEPDEKCTADMTVEVSNIIAEVDELNCPDMTCVDAPETESGTILAATITLSADACDPEELWGKRFFVGNQGPFGAGGTIKPGESKQEYLGVKYTISSTGKLQVLATAYRGARAPQDGEGPISLSGSNDHEATRQRCDCSCGFDGYEEAFPGECDTCADPNYAAANPDICNSDIDDEYSEPLVCKCDGVVADESKCSSGYEPPEAEAGMICYMDTP